MNFEDFLVDPIGNPPTKLLQTTRRTYFEKVSNQRMFETMAWSITGHRSNHNHRHGISRAASLRLQADRYDSNLIIELAPDKIDPALNQLTAQVANYRTF